MYKLFVLLLVDKYILDLRLRSIYVTIITYANLKVPTELLPGIGNSICLLGVEWGWTVPRVASSSLRGKVGVFPWRERPVTWRSIRATALCSRLISGGMRWSRYSWGCGAKRRVQDASGKPWKGAVVSSSSLLEEEQLQDVEAEQ